MENLSLKMKISMLWIFVAVGTFLYLVFLSSKPIAMEPTEGSLVIGTVVVLVPLAMPYLSMTLKDSINRWINIIAAVAYTGFQIIIFASNTYVHVRLLEVIKTVATLAIVWYAYRWPKEEAQPLKTPTPVTRETTKV